MFGMWLINRRLCGCKERDWIIGMWNTRLKETKWGLGKIGTPFEDGQGPEGAVAPYINGWNLRTKHEVNIKNTGLCNSVYCIALVAVCNVFSLKQAWGTVRAGQNTKPNSTGNSHAPDRITLYPSVYLSGMYRLPIRNTYLSEFHIHFRCKGQSCSLQCRTIGTFVERGEKSYSKMFPQRPE